jgi:hypothetical protein
MSKTKALLSSLTKEDKLLFKTIFITVILVIKILVLVKLCYIYSLSIKGSAEFVNEGLTQIYDLIYPIHFLLFYVFYSLFTLYRIKKIIVSGYSLYFFIIECLLILYYYIFLAYESIFIKLIFIELLVILLSGVWNIFKKR